jgi:hypothetical protein
MYRATIMEDGLERKLWGWIGDLRSRGLVLRRIEEGRRIIPEIPVMDDLLGVG